MVDRRPCEGERVGEVGAGRTTTGRLQVVARITRLHRDGSEREQMAGQAYPLGETVFTYGLDPCLGVSVPTASSGVGES